MRSRAHAHKHYFATCQLVLIRENNVCLNQKRELIFFLRFLSYIPFIFPSLYTPSYSPPHLFSYLHSLTTNIIQVSPPIFFVLTCIVVFEKLSDTYFFLRAQNGLQGIKSTPEKCGNTYPFNCFTYNNRTPHNQTNSSSILTIRDKKCDFVNSIKKIFGV